MQTYNEKIYFKGLGRAPLSDPDKFSSYLPGSSWAKSFYMFESYTTSQNTAYIPSDSRCVASPTGNRDYAFYSTNEWSLYLPYIRGLYALACQVKPDIDPWQFFEEMLKTSETTEIKNEYINHTYELKNIVNPVRLINSFQN